MKKWFFHGVEVCRDGTGAVASIVSGLIWLKYKQTKSSLSNNITTSSTCLDESKTKKLKHYLNFCIVWNNYVYFEVLLPFLIDAGLCMTSVGSATFCWRGWWGGRGWRRRSHPAWMWDRTLRFWWHPKILINNIITNHLNICGKTIVEPASGACGPSWKGGSGRRESSEVQHGDWRGGFCLLIHNFRQTRWQKLQLQHGNCRRGSSLILVPDSNPGFESDSWFQCSRLSLMPRSHARLFQIGMILMFNRNPHIFFWFALAFDLLFYDTYMNLMDDTQYNGTIDLVFLCLCLLGLT